MIKKPKSQKADASRIPRDPIDQDGGYKGAYSGLTVAAAISLFCHVVFFFVLIFVPKPSFETAYLPSVINVRMVSIPGPPSEEPPEAGPMAEPKKEAVTEPSEKPDEPPAEADVSIKKAEPEPEADTSKEPVQAPPEPDVSLAPKEPVKKEIKKSLKKKTFKPSEVVKSAIEKLEKKTEKTRPKSIADALEKMRKDVDKKTASAKKTGGNETAKSGKGRPSGGMPGGSGLRSWEAFDIYNVEIAYQIQKSWAFSEQLARGKTGLEARVGIKILPDGTIDDVWFDKKSGNQYLDESAIRAVKKSNPLPPLPRDFTGPYYKIGLRFTSKGLTN